MKLQHDKRDRQSGRYVSSRPCDCCGKPVGTEPLCDEEVCGANDGPGFYLCERSRCSNKRDSLDVEARRALYTAQRAKNEVA